MCSTLVYHCTSQRTQSPCLTSLARDQEPMKRGSCWICTRLGMPINPKKFQTSVSSDQHPIWLTDWRKPRCRVRCWTYWEQESTFWNVNNGHSAQNALARTMRRIGAVMWTQNSDVKHIRLSSSLIWVCGFRNSPERPITIEQARDQIYNKFLRTSYPLFTERG